MNRTIKISLSLLLAGIIAIGAGIFFRVVEKDRAARDTEPAAATVVDYDVEEEYNSSSETCDTVYYPVMSYEADGATIESRYSQYEYGQTYAIGETVEIKYDPDNPQDFILADEGGGLHIGTLWEIPLGIVLILITLGRVLVPVIMAKKR